MTFTGPIQSFLKMWIIFQNENIMDKDKDAKGAEKGGGGDEEESVLAVILPTLVMCVITLFISLICCYKIHKGNR